MIVRVPGCERRTREDLVTLQDVTATMLALAGCEVPGYMDSAPLPGLDLLDPAEREVVIGATSGGWWIDDGRWRYAKYATGDVFLYDRDADPGEQHNRIDAPEAQGVRKRLDAALTRTVMTYTREAHFDHRVYVRDLSQYTWFGREGWQRPFPRTIDDPQAR
jgi:arylsulfatase A-like enzyme